MIFIYLLFYLIQIERIRREQPEPVAGPSRDMAPSPSTRQRKDQTNEEIQPANGLHVSPSGTFDHSL